MKGAIAMTGDVLGPGTAPIDKWSWIGHAARAGHAVGHAVGHTARVVNEAKVGSVPKAGGVVRARVAGAMMCANPECGHPSRCAAQAGDALRKTGPANRQAPALTVTNKTGMLGAPHTRCPPRRDVPIPQAQGGSREVATGLHPEACQAHHPLPNP